MTDVNRAFIELIFAEHSFFKKRGKERNDTRREVPELRCLHLDIVTIPHRSDTPYALRCLDCHTYQSTEKAAITSLLPGPASKL